MYKVKNHPHTLILLSIILLLCVAIVLYAPFQNTQFAYADTIEQDSILNFNQYIKINNATNENNHFTDNSIIVGENILSRVNITQFTLLNNHKYYLMSNVESETMFYLGNGYSQYYGFYNRIIVSGSNEIVNSIVISANATLNKEFYFSIIDLTQMVGSGNEPNLTQCENLFKADYYYYTTGTPMTLNGVENYYKGSADTLNAFTFNVISTDLASNMDTCEINSNYGSTSKALIQGFYVWSNTNYTNCTAILNLGATLKANDYINFKYKCLGSQNTLTLPPTTSNLSSVHVMVIDNNNVLTQIAELPGYVSDNTFKEISFTIPFDCNALYLVSSNKYIVAYNNFELDISTFNAEAIKDLSFQSGYNNAKQYYNTYYSQGNEGYQNIFNLGASSNPNNAWGSAWDFIGSTFNSVGQIFQIELLPNVPLSVFILTPLMITLIFFIVKLTRGGSD